jgi:hypothetical protein
MFRHAEQIQNRNCHGDSNLQVAFVEVNLSQVIPSGN